MSQHSTLQTVHQKPLYDQYGRRCDALLKLDDGTVYNVNTEHLMRYSFYFYFLFLIEEETGQITVIHDIKPDIFEIIMNFASTDGHVQLTTDNVMPLLVASDFLMIPALVHECKNFVLVNKNVDSFMSFFLTAQRIKGLDNEDRCRRFIVLCFEKAVKNSMDEVCRLSYGDLKYFLSHRSLNVSDEHTVWSVIEAWVQKDLCDRLPLVPELLRCLSMNEIDDDLGLRIISSPIIWDNPFYKVMGDPGGTVSLLSDTAKAQIVMLFCNEAPFISDVRQPQFLYVVTKNLRDRPGSELFLTYDGGLDLWRKVGEILMRGARPLVSAHLVYFLRHVGDGHFELSGHVYDLLAKKMDDIELPSIYGYYVQEVGGTLYALQTFGSGIQRYEEETDEWLDMDPSMYRGCVSGALKLDGLLYVLSEIGSGVILMQGYDPSTNQWLRDSYPSKRRILAKSVVYRGHIFLIAGRRVQFEDDDDEDFDDDDDDDIGGEDLFADDGRHQDFMLDDANRREFIDDDDEDPDDHVELDDNDDESEESISREVEVYDPERNEWEVLPELPFRFFPVFVTVVNDRLYVYKNSRRPVVYWDGSGEWKVERNPSLLFDHKFCAVEDEDVVRRMTKINKEEDPTVWLDSGLAKDTS